MSAPIQDEPPILALWRRIAEIRSELVSQIRAWERPDPPAMRDVVKISKLHGRHGMTERRLREIDEAALARAATLRKQLIQLDKALKLGTPDDGNDRGLSFNQLRELAGEKKDTKDARAAARKALKAWWVKDTWLTRERVSDAIRELGSEVILTNDAFARLKRQDTTAQTARAKAGLSRESGTIEAKAARALARLLGERVD